MIILKTEFGKIQLADGRVIDNSNLTQEIYEELIAKNKAYEIFFDLVVEKPRKEKKAE
jgi:hypothetical protein